MSRFDACMRFVFNAEGGYGDDPLDRGGATNLGITQATYDNYRRRYGLPVQPVKFCTHDDAESIYHDEYWVAPRFDLLPVPLDLVCFDAGVNCGTGRSAKWLQAAVGVANDGKIGPQTLAAIEKAPIDGVVAACLAMRRDHYERICENDASQRRFYRGWMNRVARLEKEARGA